MAVSLLIFIGSASQRVLATEPAWWAERAVFKHNANSGEIPPADNYAVINQGQLKNLAVSAYEELYDRFSGNTGAALRALVGAWVELDLSGNVKRDAQGHRITKVTQATDDFAVVNLGQLKAVAKPFYERLKQAYYVTAAPWENAITAPANYAMANIGQAKNLFGFDLRRDSDNDGLPDMWEQANGFNLFNPADASGDADFDGRSNLQEFIAGKGPRDYYNGTLPVLAITGGAGQEAAPKERLPEPFRVRVSDAFGNALVNAPVEFSVTKGAGFLQASPVLTDNEGFVSCGFQMGEVGGAQVTASVRTEGKKASVVFAVTSTIQLEPPSDVVATTTDTGTVIVSWTPQGPSAGAFRVERSSDGENWSQIGEVSGAVTQFEDSSVSDELVYLYRVIAADY